MRGIRSVVFLAICISCIDPYDPRLNSYDLNMLVVDGGINSDGTASVLLNRSVDMTMSSLLNPKESNATVTIKSSSGEIYTLNETAEGVYKAADLKVNDNDRFTLNITTSSGSHYQSDDMKIYSTPAIDSVYWVVAPNGQNLEIRVDAKDSNPEATGYYLWDCTETYQYHAQVHSAYMLVNHKAVTRMPEEEVYTCWKDGIVPSTVFTTNDLTQNRISAIPIASIEKYSRKISVKYSILVRQRAISEAEYTFRSQLKKSNEQTGGIFSVLPGSVVSNVHSIENPNEFVLGYFRAQDVKQRRIFIDYDDLPGDFQQQIPIKCTLEDTCPTGQPPPVIYNCVNIMALGSGAMITGVITNSNREQISVTFTSSECADCRSWGGTTTKPLFWE